MEIIIDRKHKRANADNQWDDTFSFEQGKKEKFVTLEIEKGSDDIVDKFLMNNSLEALKGKMVYALKKGTDVMISGRVAKILVDRILLLRQGKRLIPVFFNSVISIGN